VVLSAPAADPLCPGRAYPFPLPVLAAVALLRCGRGRGDSAGIDLYFRLTVRSTGMGHNVLRLAEVAGLEALNFKIRTNDYRKHKS
jgi:hypothetical protein